MASDGAELDFSRVDLTKLPGDVRQALESLEQEFRDLDITEKGYLKKKAKLLGPYMPPVSAPVPVPALALPVAASSQLASLPRAEEANVLGALDDVIESAANATNADEDLPAPPAVPEDVEEVDTEFKEPPPEANPQPVDPERDATQRRNRRLTRRQDNRYHSEIRQEAVMKALELYKQLQNQIPLPIRRPSQRCLASNGDGDAASRTHNAQSQASNGAQAQHETIMEERELGSPERDRRSFNVFDTPTNNLSANLNASSKPDAQPKSLLNVVATTATPPYSTPTQPSKGAESSDDDDSSVDEPPDADGDADPDADRAGSHSSSNSSLLRAGATPANVSVMPTVAESQKPVRTPSNDALVVDCIARPSPPQSQPPQRKPRTSVDASPTAAAVSPASAAAVSTPQPQAKTAAVPAPTPTAKTKPVEPATPQPEIPRKPPRNSVTSSTPAATASAVPDAAPTRSSLIPTPAQSTPQPVAPPRSSKAAAAVANRPQQDIVAKPKSSASSSKSQGQPQSGVVLSAQMQIAQLIQEQLQLERGSAQAQAQAQAKAQEQTPQNGGEGESDDAPATRVSMKIQQLCKTLQRPKRKPFQEHFASANELDDVEAPQADPTGPRPEGASSRPLVGELLASPGGLPRNLEMALQKYGTSQTFKQLPAASLLDVAGAPKLSSLPYGKLWSRALAVAYQFAKLSNAKTVASALGSAHKSLPAGWTLKPGDRVALVVPNSEPLAFITAWFGCLLASVVPVAVDLPVAVRRDASSRDAGFLLSSLQVRVALTTDTHLRTLPKKPTGEPDTFRGWPPVAWCSLDSCKSPPRDWHVPPRLKDDDVALIEQTIGKDGNVMGVTVTRQAVLQHCRALHTACAYVEGETAVCVVDFKREVGFWHAVLTSIFAGMHVIFVPYNVMKVDPASWLKLVTKHKANVALVNSRDLHWSLLAQKEHKDISLSSLRLLLVADSANPWSLTSYDAFLSAFRSRGLREDALCTVAYSSEALTIALRRPAVITTSRSAPSSEEWSKRGILSMQALSFGVVRAEAEISPTSIALQDCGQPMPGSTVCVARLAHATTGQPLTLCRTDEIGELCVSSQHTGLGYFNLDGLTSQVFRTRVDGVGEDAAAAGQPPFVRTGLIGFTSPNGFVYVCGSADGLMTVGGRKHNTDDLIATVLMTEPTKFVYRGRIAVFSHTLLKDERIVVVAEQRPSCTEEDAFNWMSRVLHTVENVHQLSVYCIMLLAANGLPRMPLGGIHIQETRRRYLEGSLHPANILMCPHAAVSNLPKPRERVAPDVGPSAMLLGSIVQGQRLAQAVGRELDRSATLGGSGGGAADGPGAELDRKNVFLHETLQYRAQTTPDSVLFTLLNAKAQPGARLTCAQLHERAERIAAILAHKDVAPGSHVAIMLPAGFELVAAFFGCLYAGCVAVPIRPPTTNNLATTLRTCRLVVEVSHASAVLTQAAVIKLIKSKDAAAVCDARIWPILIDADDTSRRNRLPPHRPSSVSELAYLDFAIAANGTLAGIKCSHRLLATLCRAIKIQCELYPSRDVLLCLEAYSGLALVLLSAAGVYCGHQTFLVAASDLETNGSLWLTALSTHRIRDVFVSYSVLEMTTRLVGPRGVDTLAQRGVSLSAVRSLVVVAEERPRVALLSAFTTLLRAVGLNARAVSVSFGCRVNAAVSLQSASAADCATVFVDLRALRNDRVALVERGAPHAVCLFECGELLPGVRVVIANTDTRGQCAEGRLGEIWVASEHNADGFYAVYGAQPPTANAASDSCSSNATASPTSSSNTRNSAATGGELNAPFKNYLVTGDTRTAYARTGYLGFILRTGPGIATATGTTATAANDAEPRLFVVGALDEAIFVRGLRHYPIDIETSVVRSNKRIVEAAVFTLNNGLLVAAIEFDGAESEALDLIALATNCILEEHHLIVGVVVLLDPGVIPINSRGEKQRTHLRDSFLADQLDPIYVAYNM